MNQILDLDCFAAFKYAHLAVKFRFFVDLNIYGIIDVAVHHDHVPAPQAQQTREEACACAPVSP